MKRLLTLLLVLLAFAGLALYAKGLLGVPAAIASVAILLFTHPSDLKP